MEAAQDIIYDLKATSNVKTIYNSHRQWNSDKNGLMHFHRVVFDTGYEGEFMQSSQTLIRKNGMRVKEGEAVCFIPHEKKKPTDLDRLEMCYDIPLPGASQEDQNLPDDGGGSRPVNNTAISFSMRYATDLAIAHFKSREGAVTPEEYKAFIREMAVDMRNAILENL